MHVSVVNMCKSRCFAFVLTVVCLPAILRSLEADAHPTSNGSTPCTGSGGGASTLEVRVIASNHYQSSGGNEEVKGIGQANGTALQEVANVVRTVASNQEENAREIKDEIRDIKEGQLEIKDEIRDIRRLLASNFSINSIPIDFGALEPSKQALVSALESNCVPMLIQQNVDASDFFNRSWAEFKVGFNDSSGNYWLGNDLLSQLTTNHRYKLKFDLQARHSNNWYYAEYSIFRVMPETYNYELVVGRYSGNAGRDAFGYHNGAMFSTYDRDNDQQSSKNCATTYGGGFWYQSNSCAWCRVNVVRSYFRWSSLSGHSGITAWSDLQSSRMWLQLFLTILPNPVITLVEFTLLFMPMIYFFCRRQSLSFRTSYIIVDVSLTR